MALSLILAQTAAGEQPTEVSLWTREGVAKPWEPSTKTFVAVVVVIAVTAVWCWECGKAKWQRFWRGKEVLVRHVCVQSPCTYKAKRAGSPQSWQPGRFEWLNDSWGAEPDGPPFLRAR